MGLEARSCSCHYQHVDHTSSILHARMPRAEAEEAALGACTVGHEGVRSGGGVLLITRGIIYDVIVEPASVGSMTDEHGHQRPVAFFAYRVNGRYIMEGLASSFLFTMGGLGFINLD